MDLIDHGSMLLACMEDASVIHIFSKYLHRHTCAHTHTQHTHTHTCVCVSVYI
jgi:hypothetical protein